MNPVSVPRSIKLMIGSTVIALAGAFTLGASAMPGGGGHHHGGPGLSFGFPIGPRIERMLDSVNATEAQRAQIRQIAQAAAADLKAQRESARSLRERSMQLFTQPTVDADAAEQLRQQMLAQHDQASKRMVQAMLDVSRVLTPEQRVQLGEKMKQRGEMFERHRRERQSLEQPRS